MAGLAVVDAWQHRSEPMRCKKCMWYMPKGRIIGRCRRRSPELGGWPVVHGDLDWCGDHKLNEVALEAQMEADRENTINFTGDLVGPADPIPG